MRKKADSPQGCTLHTLAEGGVARVQRCSHCGTLSLHLGALSLRFDAAALESLWNVLGHALMALHEQEQREELPVPLTPRGQVLSH